MWAKGVLGAAGAMFWTPPARRTDPNAPLPLPAPTAEDILAPNVADADRFVKHVNPMNRRLVFLGVRRVATGKRHTDRAVGQVVGVDGGTGDVIFSLHVMPTVGAGATPIESCLTPSTGIQMGSLTGLNATPLSSLALTLSRVGLSHDVCLVIHGAGVLASEIGLSVGTHFGTCVEFADLFSHVDPVFHSRAYFDLQHLALTDGCPNPQCNSALEDARIMRWLTLRYCASDDAINGSGAQLKHFLQRATTMPPVPTKDEILRYRYDGVCLADSMSRCTCTIIEALVSRQQAQERHANHMLNTVARAVKGVGSEFPMLTPPPYPTAVAATAALDAAAPKAAAANPRRRERHWPDPKAPLAMKVAVPGVGPSVAQPHHGGQTISAAAAAAAASAAGGGEGRNVNAAPWSPGAHWDTAGGARGRDSGAVTAARGGASYTVAAAPTAPPYSATQHKSAAPYYGASSYPPHHHHHHGHHHHHHHQYHGAPRGGGGGYPPATPPYRGGGGPYAHHHHHQHHHHHAFHPSQQQQQQQYHPQAAYYLDPSAAPPMVPAGGDAWAAPYGHPQGSRPLHPPPAPFDGSATAAYYAPRRGGGYHRGGGAGAGGYGGVGERGGMGRGAGRGGSAGDATHHPARRAEDSEGAPLPVQLQQYADDDRPTNKFFNVVTHLSTMNRKREQQQQQHLSRHTTGTASSPNAPAAAQSQSATPALDSGTTFRTFAVERPVALPAVDERHLWASTPAGGTNWDVLLEEE